MPQSALLRRQSRSEPMPNGDRVRRAYGGAEAITSGRDSREFHGAIVSNPGHVVARVSTSAATSLHSETTARPRICFDFWRSRLVNCEESLIEREAAAVATTRADRRSLDSGAALWPCPNDVHLGRYLRVAVGRAGAH